jgi:hypothetical protein
MRRGKALPPTMFGGKHLQVRNVSHLPVCLLVCLSHCCVPEVQCVHLWLIDSEMTVPRAVWTPSSQQARQENLCAAEELVSSSNNLDTNNSTSSATLHNTGLMGSNTSPSWWQHQALQVSLLQNKNGTLSLFAVLYSSLNLIFMDRNSMELSFLIT